MGNISFFLRLVLCVVHEQSIFPYLMLLLLIIETEAPPFFARENINMKSQLFSSWFFCEFFDEFNGIVIRVINKAKRVFHENLLT